ncbi:unnamed protein product [Symbiodinium natans]|uniref:Fucose-specific lectin n=1 Tax=Symbiodinium natans TaxID=878477 RepID=A0A812FU84_9DINO|nr:unnamed protein product [Symbiodinium natans]
MFSINISTWLHNQGQAISLQASLDVELPTGVAVDGNSMLAVTKAAQQVFLFIYEKNDGSWEEVYRQEIGETSPFGNFLEDADISSSGKAVVTGASNNMRRASFFERGTDGIWGPTQTLLLNSSIGDVSASISATAAVVTSFVTDVDQMRINTTAVGRIIGCNTTEPTTPTPTYGHSYYRDFRRFRRRRRRRCRRCKYGWYEQAT